MIIFVYASGEAILGTLKHFAMHFAIQNFSRLRRGDFRYTKIFVIAFYDYLLYASGEAILGTLCFFCFNAFND